MTCRSGHARPWGLATRVAILIVGFGLVGTACSVRENPNLPTPPEGALGLPYRVGWGEGMDLQVVIILPPPGPNRKNGYALTLRVSRRRDMQDAIYQESLPVLSSTQEVVFRVPAGRVPREAPLYWQAFWVDRPQDDPTWALTGVVETRIAAGTNEVIATTPADDDEVPADLLHFVVEPGGTFADGPVDYGFRLSRQPQFQTVDYAWQVTQQRGPVDFRPGVVLGEGTWYAGFYAVRQTDTQALLSELVVHRFTAIPPCRTWNRGGYAVRVVAADLRCTDTSWYQNPNEALGPPDAQALGPERFVGIVSLGIDGSVTVEMGRCIADRPGMDIRVYQAVSTEGVEVQVSQFREGPWFSLGWQPCGELTPGLFSGHCDFDLAWGGVAPVRFLRIIDRQRYSHPDDSQSCTDRGVNPHTPGADIDAVQSLR